MKKRKSKGWIVILIAFVLCIGALVCVWYILQEDNDFKQDDAIHVQLRDDVMIDMDESESKSYPYDDVNLIRKIDFDALFAVNSDIFGWLYIPDTNVDYPLLQEQTLGEYYYLSHDYTKAYNANGSVFTPKEPMDMDDAHQLLFGHHMINKDVMFGQLPSKYSDFEYGAEHSYIYKYYPDRAERWLLWCAVDSDSSDKIYEIPYTIGSDTYQELIEGIASKAKYEVASKPNKDTYITILTTCNGRVGGSPVRFYLVYVPDVVYQYED